MILEGPLIRAHLQKMNLALNRVCETVANGESHSVRERVAEQIIKCASSGKTALGQLTAADQRALISGATLSKSSELSRRNDRDDF
jgi:hypothetical protein